MAKYEMTAVEFEVNIREDGKDVKIADARFETPCSFADCIEQIKAGEHEEWDSVTDFYADAIAARKVKMASRIKSRYVAEQKGKTVKGSKGAGIRA